MAYVLQGKPENEVLQPSDMGNEEVDEEINETSTEETGERSRLLA